MQTTAVLDSRGRDGEDTGFLQFFPFMPRSSWYREYWFEPIPNRVGKNAARPVRLAAKLLSYSSRRSHFTQPAQEVDRLGARLR
jgi:hypothetical protein